jgi:hypothetical protein
VRRKPLDNIGVTICYVGEWKGTSRKAREDAWRRIESGEQHFRASNQHLARAKQHFQGTSKQLDRGERRVLDSLVQLGRLASRTFRN